VAKEYSRTRRVGEQMQRELADLIQRELKDPRLGFVTVSAVDVSKDLSYAKVYVSTLGDSPEIEQTLEALSHASGFLRRELGRRMILRIVPELRFVHDVSVERGNRLSALIDRAVAEDKHKTDQDSDSKD